MKRKKPEPEPKPKKTKKLESKKEPKRKRKPKPKPEPDPEPPKPYWWINEDVMSARYVPPMSLTLSADGRYFTWSLEEFVDETHRKVNDETLRAAMLADATAALERARQRRLPPAGGWVPPAECSICAAWPDQMRNDMSTNMNATGSRFPEGAERLAWIAGDRGQRDDKHPEMRRCPDCGTYYSIVSSYEWTTIGTEDEEWMTRRKPEQAWPFLPEEERTVLNARLGLDISSIVAGKDRR